MIPALVRGLLENDFGNMHSIFVPASQVKSLTWNRFRFRVSSSADDTNVFS